jgi:hypothetical protein
MREEDAAEGLGAKAAKVIKEAVQRVDGSKQE